MKTEKSIKTIIACAREENEINPYIPPAELLSENEFMPLAEGKTDFRLFDAQLRQRYVNGIPSLKMAITHARTYIGLDENIVKEWYIDLASRFWMDKDGNPIHNWAYHLAAWAKFYNYWKMKRDPARIPDARKSGSGFRHADNWRGTKKGGAA